MRRISFAIALALVLPALATGSARETRLSLVAYSTPREAYAKLIPAFQQTAAGKDVSFTQSYGASGEQSRAVAAGLPADLVAFSLEPDITSLVQKGLVAKNWNRDGYAGMVTRSVVVFVLRDGNPKHIKTWDDLGRPTARSSGPGPKAAIAYLGKLFKHVAAQPSSAREALQTFWPGVAT